MFTKELVYDDLTARNKMCHNMKTEHLRNNVFFWYYPFMYQVFV